MKLHQTNLAGALLIEPEPFGDERGLFARVFCERVFAEKGLETRFVQHSVSRSRVTGTLRGMHFQTPPHDEVKLVRCIRGALYDVILDLRADSPTRGQWQGFELTAENMCQLYIPAGFAHGFQTLCDDTEISYLISAFYAPEAASGVRYDDPAFGIEWPLPVSVVSEKDRGWRDFEG
jgi:dTDP-4-dehydrorhamnose 3,5-epimerase